MTKHLTSIVALGLILASSGAAAAQSPAQSREARPRQQLRLAPRIRDGVGTGQLTREEVSRLRQRITELRARAQQARKDGTITPQQRRELLQEWRRTSRLLFRMKHNRLRR